MDAAASELGYCLSIRVEIKRFFALDSRAYEPGALPARTKELMGLVASIVLRCDDCISYHVIQCAKCGVAPAEFEEAFGVALIVGGSISASTPRRGISPRYATRNMAPGSTAEP